MNHYLKKIYYFTKPLIPRRLQIEIRRKKIRNELSDHSQIWPIYKQVSPPPQGWTGWPGGKRFAVVLTHDVEKAEGQRKCYKLMMMEAKLGFRSSFNFLAEEYVVSQELRRYLTNKGFEVGVHGLNHRGTLYKSRKQFLRQAARINSYMKEWQAVGFRSPSMHHNLEWIHDLNIEYDASTFDTDPFEPQPDGMGAIFPFWVTRDGSSGGYVELPYTLPQDFTLFVIMQEKNIDIWKKKLDWIAEQGGMALLISHPDYMNFSEGNLGLEEYPANYYGQLLNYIKERYKGQYWNPLPKEVASFWREKFISVSQVSRSDGQTQRGTKKIWIDLDNSPHVPFFKPIIEELKKRDNSIMLTAKDSFQTCGLADLHHMKYKRIGRHYGKNKLMKVIGLLIRALQLVPIAIKEKPDLAVSHGSRAQLAVAFLLRIPSVWLADYEYVRGMVKPTLLMMPEVISTDKFSSVKRILQYPGIKEDVYVPGFKPTADVRRELRINDNELVVTVRPPATEAHYHNPESEKLFETVIDYLGTQESVRIIIVPRNEKQTSFVRSRWNTLCMNGRVIIPDHVVDGLELLWSSDLVISGGGTMNREAAALGVPVYSLFRGKLGAVDKYLSETGRLVLISNTEDVRSKLALIPREKNGKEMRSDNGTLNFIVEGIVNLMESSSNHA
jgi:predicted glycosyltransferase/peptidoglycan/xylan/chitin deacetylase (PgdA/CDA1 family)